MFTAGATLLQDVLTWGVGVLDDIVTLIAAGCIIKVIILLNTDFVIYEK